MFSLTKRKNYKYQVQHSLPTLAVVERPFVLQFQMFAWCHLTILLVVMQSSLLISTMFNGLIWCAHTRPVPGRAPTDKLPAALRFILPALLIVCNDTMAYFFGFFWGRTPVRCYGRPGRALPPLTRSSLQLIKLSPKKTWEGFIGGALSTFFCGFFVRGRQAHS